MSPASRQPVSGLTQPRKDEQDGKEDLLATLFSPPTPPASPLPAPAFSTTVATPTTKPQSSKHSRNISTSSCEFGSFVSVPAADDPLYADHQAAFSPISPTSGLEFFDQFTDHATKSNAQKRQVLDELLLHEDDPLYWVTPDMDALETDTKQLRLSQPPIPQIPEEPSLSDLQGRGMVSDRYVTEPERHLSLICICSVRHPSISTHLRSPQPHRSQSPRVTRTTQLQTQMLLPHGTQCLAP